jgi:hypothetical protein
MQVSNSHSQVLNEHYIIIALLLAIIYMYVTAPNIAHYPDNCPHCKRNIQEPFAAKRYAGCIIW